MHFIVLFFILTTSILIAEKPIIIGIAGGTGSGKTTFALKIKEALGKDAEIIEEDCYYKDLKNLSFEEKIANNYDHPDSLEFSLLEKHLIELKNNHPIYKPQYNFTLHERDSNTIEVQPVKVIIVEGILLFSVENIRNLLDLKIYIETDDDIRILRRLQRDIFERGRNIDGVIKQYFATVKPMHMQYVAPSKNYADVIISGVNDHVKTLNLINFYLQGH